MLVKSIASAPIPADEAALRDLHKQRKSDATKLINPVPNPRYDEVYHDGVTWLESLL